MNNLKIIHEKDYLIVEKSWGFERWIVNTPLYCGKELFCLYNRWSSKGKFHYHKEKSETFFVVKGDLEIELKKVGEEELTRLILEPGDSLSIEPMMAHRFRCLSKEQLFTKFIEFSTHHEDSDSYYLEPKN